MALLFFYGGGTDQDRARLDVVRTAGALVLGTGGAIALLLTARRQRSTELTLEHQRRVAAAAERDAAEQRITELYAHAVDQLGNDKAPVRLGGLHALERLAQDNPNQRQTIVDVICAYLRMPYTPPANKPPGEDAPADAHAHYEKRRQELQVRMTAQRILTGHLQPKVADVFWHNIHLDLTEAHLHRLDLTGCHMRKAQFAGVRFSGPACFERAQFTEEAQFSAAKFTAEANFRWVSCLGDARFDGAEFAGEARFGSAWFDGEAGFEKTRFAKNADFGHDDFDGARFAGGAQFSGAKFFGNAWFDWAKFAGLEQFGNQVEVTEFAGEAGFCATRFGGQAQFSAARFAMDATFTKRDGFVGARFGGSATFSRAEFR